MKRFAFSVIYVLSMALLMACGNGKTSENEIVPTDTTAVEETPQEPKQKKHVDDYHGIKPASVDTMEMVVDSRTLLRLHSFISRKMPVLTVKLFSPKLKPPKTDKASSTRNAKMSTYGSNPTWNRQS